MSDPSDSVPQILIALEQLQPENATLRHSLLELQSITSSVIPTTTLNPPPPQAPYYEPKVSVPDKIDGMHPELRGFLNQIRLIIRL